MESYTIYEYNSQLKTYKEIGNIEADNSKRAIDRWKSESGWSQKSCEIILFAKIPICR
jgi:hypothetical protein